MSIINEILENVASIEKRPEEFTVRDVAAQGGVSLPTAARRVAAKFECQRLTRRRGIENGRAVWFYREAGKP